MKNTLIIKHFFENKSDYSFSKNGKKIELFKERLTMFACLNITLEDVKNFKEIYEATFGISLKLNRLELALEFFELEATDKEYIEAIIYLNKN